MSQEELVASIASTQPVEEVAEEASPSLESDAQGIDVAEPVEELASVAARVFLAISAATGVFVAAAPQIVFPVCEFAGLFRTGPSGEHLLMRCHETAVLAVWVGAAIAALSVGGMIWGTGRAAQVAGSGIVLGGFVTAILPLVIAPVCQTATMPCVAGTQPALVVSGVVIMVLGAAAYVLGLRRSA